MSPIRKIIPIVLPRNFNIADSVFFVSTCIANTIVTLLGR
jgi:hypothetical protein